METFFTADSHLSHDAIRLHCRRPYATVEDMDSDIVQIWNSTVSSKDIVYIVGDFAWRNHRRWINDLNGKKVLIIGNHDKMPQDALDLFRPDWTCEDMTVWDVVKTMAQFREVHQQLDRVICGQRMTLNHFPMRSWSSSVHGTWCVTGHCHGRMRETRPGESSGGLILDVGWDLWRKPLSFEEVKKEMMWKFERMPQNFREHVLHGKPLGRTTEDEDVCVT